jgi:ferritin-like metal-binding protein YciE
MRLDSPEVLLREEIQAMYHAETQLVLALPRMAGRAKSPELVKAFENHLTQTKTHVLRLEKAAAHFGWSCCGRKSLAMQGAVMEGDLACGYGGDPALVDTVLIAASRNVEHLEMAYYQTLISLARMAGANEALQLFEQTLKEEQDTQKQLDEIAKQLGAGMMAGAGVSG